MTIKLLDDDLINKIAAGEVIERPASIVKELIENSIDAQASKITVSFVNGGKDCIEVEDDGLGLTREEIPVAFLRHATSKITAENDLYNIYTMGFRGEALPSIASVSKITLFSNKSVGIGVKAQIEGGVIQDLDAYPFPKGTRIIVSDLFYNTPARKSFLKTTITEGNAINEIVNRYALAYPDISFTLIKDNRQYYKTPGNGDLLDAVKIVLGYEIAESLLKIDYTASKYSVKGLISSPDFTRRNRRNQYFFINNRPVRSPMLYKAIDTGYKGLLISREYPVAILSIKLNSAEVDVNVHPQKTEVRFNDEKGVFQVVYQTLRDKLTSIDYNPVHKWGLGDDSKNQDTKKPEEHIFESTISQTPITSSRLEFEEAIFYKPSNPTYMPMEKPTPDFDQPRAVYNIIGQYDATYILMEDDEALWLIDQHAAEEKINYTRLKKQYENNLPAAQVLAFPVTLDLSSQDIEIVMANMELFNRLGFNIDLIGYESIILRSAPAVGLGQEREIILDIIELLKSGESIDLFKEALITMACKQSVKAGERLNFHQMEKLIEELFKTEDYRNCPHGRPTLIKLNSSDIEKMFKR